MAVEYKDIESFIKEEVAQLTGQSPATITENTVLVGAGRVVDSADLVMLLLAAEDFARDKMNAHFDWSSDSAMSEARSVLRSVGSLSKHLAQLTPDA